MNSFINTETGVSKSSFPIYDIYKIMGFTTSAASTLPLFMVIMKAVFLCYDLHQSLF